MRSLGYPRVISMENFRNPNFELVADCLDWLVSRYDDTAKIDDDISTESDRVFFLKAVAQVFSSKARLKLNVKRLYAADGLAVKELLKIAELLRDATERANAEDDDDLSDLSDPAAKGTRVGNGEGEASSSSSLDALLADFDASTTRKLASEITRRGAAMHDALGEETEQREARLRATHREVDVAAIERQVREQIAGVRETTEEALRALANLEKDEQTLEAKTEKRRAELERGEKRLSTLESVRPAYMDEYDRLREGLGDLYAAYLERHRNLHYLEAQLEARREEETTEADARDAALEKMRKRLRAEELKVLRGETSVDDAEDEFDEDSFDQEERRRAAGGTRGEEAGGAARGASKASKASGLAAAGKRFGLGGGVVGGEKTRGGAREVVGSLRGGGGDDTSSDESSDDGIRDDGDEGTSSDDNDF